MNPNEQAWLSLWGLIQDQWDREVVTRWQALQLITQAMGWI